MMIISKDFKFDSAHNLINYKGKCENLHGHTYKLRVSIKGTIDNNTGMIIDFGLIKEIVNREIIEKLDHKYLNDIIPISTAENLAIWIWNNLEDKLKSDHYSLYEITIWETEDSFVSYRKD